MAALAQFKRDLLRERVRSSIAAARRRGVVFGRRPGQLIKADRHTPRVLKLVGEGPVLPGDQSPPTNQQEHGAGHREAGALRHRQGGVGRHDASTGDRMLPKDHWEQIYSRKATTSVSWYQEHASRSLNLIRATGVASDGSIIDVGGGASTLVDDLLADGFTNVTVLDLSGAALDAARRRLGRRAALVHWLEADITQTTLTPHTYDVWHDRAVFHFLTAPDDRAAYVHNVLRAVKPGGHVIVAAFAEEGPTQCSGLPVVRFSADQLHSEFGEQFALLRHEKEAHHTPAGTVQQFVYCHCRKVGS